MAEIVGFDKKLIKTAKELRVFKKAYGVSLDVHKRCLMFPKSGQFALSSQMRRASKSICANVVEGFAKQSYSKAEFRRFLSMAIGSAAEMELWADHAYDLDYMDESTYRNWPEKYDHIQRMLRKLMTQY